MGLVDAAGATGRLSRLVKENTKIEGNFRHATVSVGDLRHYSVVCTFSSSGLDIYSLGYPWICLRFLVFLISLRIFYLKKPRFQFLKFMDFLLEGRRKKKKEKSCSSIRYSKFSQMDPTSPPNHTDCTRRSRSIQLLTYYLVPFSGTVPPINPTCLGCCRCVNSRSTVDVQPFLFVFPSFFFSFFFFLFLIP